MNQYLTALLKLTPLVIAALFLGGCVTATVQEVRERATGIVGSETVVVLGRRSRPSNDETEIDFIRCVADNLGSDRVNVLAEQEFVDLHSHGLNRARHRSTPTSCRRYSKNPY